MALDHAFFNVASFSLMLSVAGTEVCHSCLHYFVLFIKLVCLLPEYVDSRGTQPNPDIYVVLIEYD